MPGGQGAKGAALGGLGEAGRLKPKAAVGACDGWTKPTFQGPMDGKSESDGMGRNDEVHAWPIDSGRRHCELNAGNSSGMGGGQAGRGRVSHAQTGGTESRIVCQE
eukprot:EG_transcript_27655